METESELTDEMIATIIEEANNLFRHTSGLTFDNPFSGVDTEIEFCLAKTTPDNTISTGIIRHSEIVDPSNEEFYEFIQASLWDVNKYNNIYIMSNFIDNYCSLYMPTFDATFFSAECFQADVFTHEMGHYLSLEHTYEESCDNNNCLVNGDYVCDTPPKVGKGMNGGTCENPANSCTTDEDDTHDRNPYRPVAQGGMGDQVDMVENYMDDTQDCWGAFTTGQKSRMRFNIKNRRLNQINSSACDISVNPICDSPIIKVGNSYSGSTMESSYNMIENMSTHCGSGGLGAPNEFYLLNGIDEEVTISLCDANYDTRIDVYSIAKDDCNTGRFICVGGNDDFCQLQSSITFFADANQDYYVMVHGFLGARTNTGIYTLSVDFANEVGCETVSNSDCGISIIHADNGSAVSIPLQNNMEELSYTIGNNSCTKSGNNPSCDPDGAIEDVWYKFKNGSKDTTIVKLKLMGDFPAQLINFAVFDACDSREVLCKTGGGEITIGKLSNLIKDKYYFIQVWSAKENVGEFGIAVYDKETSISIDQIPDAPYNSTIQSERTSSLSNSSLQISPNPLKTDANISFYSEDDTPVSLQVFDLNGQLKLELHPENRKGWNTSTITFSSLMAGMYYVVLQTSNGIDTQKITVVK